MAARATSFRPRQAAGIAGAAYLITSATSFWNLYLSSTLVVGNSARTAANIVANAQLFRVFILFDLLTCIGCVVLNAALYDLLAPVHRSLARLAAFWRLAESGVYGASTVSGLLVLTVLTGSDYAAAFTPLQLQALALLFRRAHEFGFIIAMVFLSLGSTAYMYVLFRSRYVPKVLALCGMAMSVLGSAFFLARTVFPGSLAATMSGIQKLPVAALVMLAVIALPFLAFEVTLGFWLLWKGVRIPAGANA